MFIVTAGQSNAVSWGTNTLSFPNTWPVDDGIKIWTHAGFVTYVPGVTSGGIGTGEFYPTVWGPEAQFALDMRTCNPNEPVWIYKQAVNGTGIAQDPAAGDWSPYSTGEAFSTLSVNLPIAMGQANVVNVKYLLWTGCETDSLVWSHACNLQHNLALLITAIRERTNSPDMVAIVAQILGNFPNYTYAATVRAAQASIVLWPNCRVFDGGVNYVDASYHYTPSGVVSLGHQFFDSAKMK